MNESRPTITVYRAVADVTEVCGFGDKHIVDYCETTALTETGQRRPFDNGYTIEETPLYADSKGRIYHAQPSIDLYGPMVYRRDDGTVFYSRPGARHARDLDGRPIDDRTPAGPSLADLRAARQQEQTREMKEHL